MLRLQAQSAIRGEGDGITDTDHKRKPTETAEDLLWDDMEWEDDGEDGAWAGSECTDEELADLEGTYERVEQALLDLARILYWCHPLGVKQSPHAEYMQGLLDKYGVGSPPDELKSEVLH
jgi:hypothetical protein